jgi:hypothetical protein
MAYFRLTPLRYGQATLLNLPAARRKSLPEPAKPQRQDWRRGHHFKGARENGFSRGREFAQRNASGQTSGPRHGHLQRESQNDEKEFSWTEVSAMIELILETSE